MLRSRIDRLTFRLLAGLLLIVFLVYGVPFLYNTYQTAQRNRLIAAAGRGDTATVQNPTQQRS